MAEEKKNTKEYVQLTEEDIAALVMSAKVEGAKEAMEAFEEKYAPLLQEQTTKQRLTAAQRREHSEGYIPETKEQLERAEERVERTIPIDESEPEELNITVNGETIQVLRGHTVSIKRKFAEVVDNMMKQRLDWNEMDKELRKKENQVQYVE